MNDVIGSFWHNPVLEHIVCDFADKKISAVIRNIPQTGEPLVTLVMDGAEDWLVHMRRGTFEEDWNEIRAVLLSITDVKVGLTPLTISEVKMLEDARREHISESFNRISEQTLQLQKKSLEKAKEFFNWKWDKQFLEMFGPNCKSIDEIMKKRIHIAERRLKEGKSVFPSS